MTLAGRAATNHPQQVAKRGALAEVDDRATALSDYEPLHARFGFTVDVAAAEHNAKCARYYTREDDGLTQSWAGEVVWCNPPYSEIGPWVQKAWQETTATVVMLVPANRTEVPWWQELVEPYRDRPGSRLRVEFLPGRLRFKRPGEVDTRGHRPPFGCVLLIWQTLAPRVDVGGLFT